LGSWSFVLGSDEHYGVQKVFIQEGHTGFYSMSHTRFICSQAIGSTQQLNPSDSFFLEFFIVGSVVEVQITTKDFICSFSRQNYLNSEFRNLFRKEEHRG